ncbi:MAG: hypothetical protein KDC04_03240 [Saprospiraceae bacterium]|nr:hypothetical protein [Saprospiraceae bacterium]
MFQKEFCKYICVIVVFMFSTPIQAQVNLKVGYIGAKVSAENSNAIINAFNQKLVDEEANVHDNLNNIKFMNGLEIGLRYRLHRVGFELSWSSMSSKSDVYATLPNNQLFQDKWFYSLTEYSVGIENYLGKFGYGASIGYRTYRIKTDIPGVQRKKSLINSESGLASKFYLLFQYPGQKVGIAFKPYVQVPLTGLNISKFDQALQEQIIENYQAPVNLEDDITLFGISILLYNGKQD